MIDISINELVEIYISNAEQSQYFARKEGYSVAQRRNYISDLDCISIYFVWHNIVIFGMTYLEISIFIFLMTYSRIDIVFNSP